MEKSGVALRQRLGLENVGHVMINRVIGYPTPIYYLWYDTSRNIPITWNMIKYSPIVSRLRFAPDLEREVTMTPLIDLEHFNANLSNGIYITVDLAGKRLANDLIKEKAQKDGLSLSIRLSIGDYSYATEFVTMKDLTGGNEISDITRTAIAQRQKNNGSETGASKLTKSLIEGRDAYFFFTVDPTNGDEGDKLHKPILNVAKTGKISSSTDGMYHVTLKLIDFMDWYETKPDGYEVKTQDIKEVLDASYVQVFSDSPSFWYQGFAMRLSTLDGSIHVPKVDKGLWKSQHGGSDYTLLDKHTSRLFKQLAFYRNLMASSISKTLRNAGLR